MFKSVKIADWPNAVCPYAIRALCHVPGIYQGQLDLPLGSCPWLIAPFTLPNRVAPLFVRYTLCAHNDMVAWKGCARQYRLPQCQYSSSSACRERLVSSLAALCAHTSTQTYMYFSMTQQYLHFGIQNPEFRLYHSEPRTQNLKSRV